MSAQRGKSTWRVISALDCPLTSAPREVLHALLHVECHAILAHEDVDKIHDFPRIAGTSIAVNPEREFYWRMRPQDPSRRVVDTADGVCGSVRGSAIEGVLLAGQAGNLQTQQSSNQLNVRGESSQESDFRINDGGMCGRFSQRGQQTRSHVVASRKPFCGLVCRSFQCQHCRDAGFVHPVREVT